VNAAHEREKHGCSFAELPNLVTAIQSLPQLRLKGIMSIPPALYHDSEPIEVPELYRQLRLLADQIGEKQLSLGMSSDLETAIMAGSNVVRVGTMLFGGRPS
ncbi:MAG: alanine racemase, partial [Proteobacteria bacterium]|nr:alanine racemase [Pseudomonadota bacterium]